MEQITLQIPQPSGSHKRSELGQFMTPPTIADFMGSLFTDFTSETVSLLDAGAGTGSLTMAFLDHLMSQNDHIKHIDITAFEIDEFLRDQLMQNLKFYNSKENVFIEIMGDDFIERAIDLIQFQPIKRFTHAIMNPPYKKISSHSRHRLLLRQVGIETVNLYSAFLALAIKLMNPGGQIVAIIPRSFCNGPYYKPFREHLLKLSAIQHIHLFNARDKAFKGDNVLQENVILLIQLGLPQGNVTISTSTDDSFADYWSSSMSFEQIVKPDDPEKFIHIPINLKKDIILFHERFKYSLADLGIDISTGPVVDFRFKKHLRTLPEPGTVPLIYPGHFLNHSIEWPKIKFKKSNAIVVNDDTKKLLFLRGYYTIVRRFSSKEEKRRIIASVVSPQVLKADYFGFENHLNVFHHSRGGLTESLARGLMIYLNSTVFDLYFRQFSGHTQVNATDLRLMKYPSREILVALGDWSSKQEIITQEIIDNKLETMV
jgi:adenine-specific DNA-methyltransferase